MSRNAAILACLLGTLMAAASISAVRAEPPVPLCKEYAERYAQQQTSGGILKGGIVGSGVGAAIGALAGGAAAGAAIGGGLGLIGGGAKKSSAYKATYVDAFTDCMAGRVTPD